MFNRTLPGAACAVALACAPMPAEAETPREALMTAVFAERDTATALSRIDRVLAATRVILARSPGDQDAAMVDAAATGYRVKLTGNRGEAIAARRKFEALVAKFPNNAEAHMALGGWHLGAIATAGSLLARVALGAKHATGLAEIDRALRLGEGHAAYPALAALMRLELDAEDAEALRLAEAAVRAGTSTPLDRQMQRAAATVLVALRKGDRKAAQVLAKALLPLGQITKSS